MRYDRADRLMQTARRTSRWPDDPVRKLANNTYLLRRDTSAFEIWLHKTPVVTILPGDRYQLRADGWLTVTTKDRINSFSPARVQNWKGSMFDADEWAVVDDHGYWLFEDGIDVDSNGQVISRSRSYEPELLMSHEERRNRRAGMRRAVEKAKQETDRDRFDWLLDFLVTETRDQSGVWYAHGSRYHYAFEPVDHLNTHRHVFSRDRGRGVQVYVIERGEVVKEFVLANHRFDLESPLVVANRWRWLKDLADGSREIRNRYRLRQLVGS